MHRPFRSRDPRAAGAALLAAAAVAAAFPSSGIAGEGPLGLEECGSAEGHHQCSGLVETWDGVPLDTTVTLPAERSRGLPLVVELHGFGNSKWEYLDPASTAYTGNAYGWAAKGYGVLTFTARGLWGSCGTPESRLASPAACADGYVHLADVRYEVRDAQELIGRLVDEGYADRRRIGVTGDSYGGGQSLMLAALRNRVMRPDGELERWHSPEGTPLRIAAAAPVIPWSDLVSAAAPNGAIKDAGVTSRREATRPVGVSKSSFINGVAAAAQFAAGPGQPLGEPFVPGRPMGFLAPAGSDPEADVIGWVARTNQGEPYDDASAREVRRMLARYHSAYYVKPRRPPPLLLAAGFTDDFFPVDESLRFANRTARRWPGVPLSLLLGDFGHQRAANKEVEREHLLRAVHGWFDRHLRGRRTGPRPGALAYVQTCPRATEPLGPYRAGEFAGLSRRMLHRRFGGAHEVISGSGDPAVAAAVDPVSGGGDGCAETERATAAGTARVALAPRRRGLTMIGSPRLRARIEVSGARPQDAQLQARLWDIAPDGRTQRLVARGSYRPREGRNRWQLHPGSWRFRRGHTAELELLGADAPYARTSNAAFTLEISKLRLRLPVR